jgi:flavin-dependent dehydrogenase
MNWYKPRKQKFSKILVAIDGSETSMKAAEYAIEIASEQKENNNNNAALWLVSTIKQTKYYKIVISN